MLKIGNKRIAYSVERIAYSKKRNIFFHSLSAKRYPLNARNGFTLVEVMAAAVILALGVVMIYQGFFISLDSLGYCLDYLRLSPLADEKIWQAQDAFRRLGPKAELDTSGNFIYGRRSFGWNLSYNLLEGSLGLYEINLSVLWQNGQRTARLNRGAYALYEYEE